MDEQVVVTLDRDEQALIGELEAQTGMTQEEILSLLIQQGIEKGLDAMLLERRSLGPVRPR